VIPEFYRLKKPQDPYTQLSLAQIQIRYLKGFLPRKHGELKIELHGETNTAVLLVSPCIVRIQNVFPKGKAAEAEGRPLTFIQNVP